MSAFFALALSRCRVGGIRRTCHGDNEGLSVINRLHARYGGVLLILLTARQAKRDRPNITPSACLPACLSRRPSHRSTADGAALDGSCGPAAGRLQLHRPVSAVRATRNGHRNWREGKQKTWPRQDVETLPAACRTPGAVRALPVSDRCGVRCTAETAVSAGK